MIPTRRFFYCGCLTLLLILIGRGAAWSTQAAWILFALLAFAFLLDGWMASSRPRLVFHRNTPPRLHVDQPHRIEWVVENRSPFPVRLRLRDQWPQASRAEPTELAGTAPARSLLTLSYQLTSTRRGDAAFGDLLYRVAGPLGLAWSTKRRPAVAPIRVLPHLANWKTAELAVRRALIRQSGSHRYRWRGAGTLFESLREYSPEDDIRWVEWKATARTGRPISRNFEVERHQQVMLLVDAGRMMTTYCANRTKFDAVLEAAILAARAVVDQGDSLGLVVFSDRVDAYLHPSRNRSQIRTVMESLYDRHPRLVESNFESALTLTAVRVQRRSLIILFTDVTVVEAAERLLLHLRRLASRHLTLVVTIADETVEALELTEPDGADELYRVAVANEMMLQRAQLLKQLRAGGAEVLDTHADRIATQTIERYFELKRRLRL